jgi:hypothetical protein
MGQVTLVQQAPHLVPWRCVLIRRPKSHARRRLVDDSASAGESHSCDDGVRKTNLGMKQTLA